MMLTTVVIDDEPTSTELIKMMLEENCEDMQVLGTANSVEEGINLILRTRPDLVFLDIDMPKGSGFDIVKAFPERQFDVVFITAYNQHAIKAFKVNAIDYILKPVDVSELIASVNTVRKFRKDRGRKQPDIESILQTIRPEKTKIAVTTIEGTEFISVSDMIRVEADRSYSVIYLAGGRKIMISKNLSEFESQLDNRDFYRLHKSYLINLQHVQRYSAKDGGYAVMTDGSKVLVSKRKRHEFMTVMTHYISRG